jgi:hypothetical protein
LVQVIVTSLAPTTFYVFLNDRAVPEMDVESLSIDIEVQEGGDAIVRATLARYVDTVTGQKTLQHNELFPSTLEIVALNRRLSITCTNADSLEGLWINLGLRPDGSSKELQGVRALRFLLTRELLDAKLTWEDGTTEDVLPLSGGV